MLALAGLIAVLSWYWADDGPIGVSQPQEQAEAGRAPVEPVTPPPVPTPEPVTEGAVSLADPVRPLGSMRAYLLTTPQANRHRILGLAVTEKGYECGSVKSASLIGTSGSAWRAHCGDTHIYWVVVGEFSQFSVSPMPYGDLDLPSMRDRDFPPVQPRGSESEFLGPPETR